MLKAGDLAAHHRGRVNPTLVARATDATDGIMRHSIDQILKTLVIGTSREKLKRMYPNEPSSYPGGVCTPSIQPGDLDEPLGDPASGSILTVDDHQNLCIPTRPHVQHNLSWSDRSVKHHRDG